jgi:glycosyltransferase involved in cell wall biosynthesis
MNKILVSICCLAYNHESYIRNCLDGFITQRTNFDFEVIIHDDASNDKTAEIIKEYELKYPNLIKPIYQIENQWSKGVRITSELNFPRAKGKYIALCEGDDYWTDPYKLQKQVDFLEANSDYVLSFHKVKILKTDGILVEDFITKVPENYENQETLARLGNYIHTPSVVFRNIIKEFPPEMKLSPIGDFFLYMLLSRYGKLNYLDETMAVYRYGVGTHSSKDEIKMAKANFKLFALLLSNSNNYDLNRILIDRQLNVFDNFEKSIRSEYSESFVSNHIFFKAIKSLNNPRKFWRKLKNKFK